MWCGKPRNDRNECRDIFPQLSLLRSFSNNLTVSFVCACFPLFSFVSFNFFVSYYFVLILRTKADAPIDDGKSPFVTARAVTTRTATTHEDLGTNARTQQLEEKTVAHSMTSSATRQEQRTVTQEVKTTSTVVGGDQVIIPFSFLYLFFLFFHLWLFNELISVAIKETITIHLFQYEDFLFCFYFLICHPFRVFNFYLCSLSSPFS